MCPIPFFLVKFFTSKGQRSVADHLITGRHKKVLLEQQIKLKLACLCSSAKPVAYLTATFEKRELISN